MNPTTSKARAGALAAGFTGPAGGMMVLLAINEVIPDAPWIARAIIFCVVAGLIGYAQVWRAAANRPKDGA